MPNAVLPGWVSDRERFGQVCSGKENLAFCNFFREMRD